MIKALAIFVLGVAVVIGLFRFRAIKSEQMVIERFAKVPSSPNCVSSETTKNDAHFIEPIAFTRTPAEVNQTLKNVIAALPRTKLATEDTGYFRFEFRSGFFGFIDDVEFRVDDASKTLRVRSASRVGKSDLGVNRKRVEMLRTMLSGKI